MRIKPIVCCTVSELQLAVAGSSTPTKPRHNNAFDIIGGLTP
jgi:hypothetical protein